jgi:hypothetical protein
MLDQHEAGLGQPPQMLRHRRLTNLDRSDDLAHRERPSLTRKQVQNLDPGRIRETAKPARIQLRLFPLKSHRQSTIHDEGRPRKAFIRAAAFEGSEHDRVELSVVGSERRRKLPVSRQKTSPPLCGGRDLVGHEPQRTPARSCRSVWPRPSCSRGLERTADAFPFAFPPSGFSAATLSGDCAPTRR